MKPPPDPKYVSRIEINYVARTVTLWDFDDLVATYRPERIEFDVHIVAYDATRPLEIDALIDSASARSDPSRSPQDLGPSLDEPVQLP